MGLRRLITAVGLGVGAMYFFDPELGKSRRAKFRDQLNSNLKRTRHDAEARLRDIRNRAQGAYHEMTEAISGPEEHSQKQEREKTATKS